MIVLAFDTAQGALSAAVRDGEGELAAIFEERTRGHAEALMPMLETVLAEAALGFAGLDALAVTVGPGTFTGLRVGLAAARGLALARGLPLVGVTTLEAVAAPVSAVAGEAVVAAFDARRDEIYLQVFDDGLADARPQPDASNIARLAVSRLAVEGPEAFRVPPPPLYIRAPDAKLPGGRDPGEAA